ncbi:MAG: YfiR family protein [Rickettsiales bacterium]|nr:YfiR family protein [Rickettsiales bacterium]
MKMRWRSAYQRLALAYLMVCMPAGLLADVQSNLSAMKAHMIFNFPAVIEWPHEIKRHVQTTRLCALGSHGAVMQEVKRLMMGQVGSHATLNPEATKDSVSECDILFVAAENEAYFLTLRHRLSALAVLTIGEGEAFIRSGGMIAFADADAPIPTKPKNQVGFYINPRLIEARKLRFDPMLLELADRIIEVAP